MNVLILNCGSSSIKYQLIDMPSDIVLSKGLIDKIGLKGAKIKNHEDGIKFLFNKLVDKKYGSIKNLKEIKAVGHRVVHGGEKFKSSILIDDKLINEIEKCIELAPLHNHLNLKGILAIKKILPKVKQVAVFDTAFHHTIPDFAYTYGLPFKYYKKYKVRKYGFHGTSHRYVAERACEILNLNYKKQKIITCHLGNGVSLTAIKNGESVDTSMGMTPLEGLVMGTRSGDVDPGALFYIMKKEKLNLNDINEILNKKSGLLGVSEKSSDMRDILDGVKKKDKKAILAYNIYIYRLKKYIGAYIAGMNGLDILVFTGGSGENSPKIRKDIIENMDFFGLKINEKENLKAIGKEVMICDKSSKSYIMSIPTNEEFMIAKDTYEIVILKTS